MKPSASTQLNFQRPTCVGKLKTEDKKAMTTSDASTDIPDDVKAELQEALDDLAKGIRRPEKMKTARAHMDRIREENRKLFREQNIAVELIRQTRDNP
jgi:predicted TIM-barrel fold metal-dependent hydrolase